MHLHLNLTSEREVRDQSKRNLGGGLDLESESGGTAYLRGLGALTKHLMAGRDLIQINVPKTGCLSCRMCTALLLTWRGVNLESCHD